MDWNKNGKLDAADLFTTELFEEELENNMSARKQEKSDDRKSNGNPGDNVPGWTKQ